jgi:hypothetical protein
VPGVIYTLEAASVITGPFTYADSTWADSTNTIWEIPLDLNERSLFYKVGVQ